MQHEIYNIIYEVFAPKMLTLNLPRPLNLTSILQEMQVIVKPVKHHYEETIRQVQTMEHSTRKLDWLFKTALGWGVGAETGLLMRSCYNYLYFQGHAYIWLRKIPLSTLNANTHS